MGGAMPTVAEQLRVARETLRLDVYQVAEITKIRTDHIRALEAGNYDLFVAPVYIRGFVRTYATLLKLEVPKVMADLQVELAQTEKFAEPPALTNQPKSWLDVFMLYLSRIDWRILAGVLLVSLLMALAVIGYRVWHAHKTADPLQKLGPAMYQPRPEPAGDTLPLPRPGGGKN
jgi:cytoskeletal protein RodZ